MFKICSTAPFLGHVIYRTPKPSVNFAPDLSELLSFIVVNYDKAIIVGDFNIHIDEPTNEFGT